ncbi:bifunctional adenosylcobinamide kinase/adenosylcobinamide-phosphate guanylyltransferase [Parasporobacterium paucivorans]|uniref:Adenosylcobinamide kinase /adenosylcobinamide-phosphate guanylyltransferase n=1 Tax=Parasporobacterium paucivorans DSM 15970 TaxID=1122934 RepID=A0A1M6KIK6_9FIRM|nr:bifunctional adenosylcobinamide kinase/adenosylcobinamide-phosphate guanylyltransferase [Parasporobacterium paucivorans]SHJ58765.1 adenosylcobinamide kinase /adenosylcobinamide-phosphate guanylyltransferase [Parasporobacterium paucivorans DSM 15970]
MLLITGGAFQGKKDYALQLTGLAPEDVCDGLDCEYETVFHAAIIDNFHLLIRRMLLEEKDMDSFIRRLVGENPEAVVIVNELGCGVIPTDPFDRKYRETCGRTSCRLAKSAVSVHRVVCGIGMVIKRD